MREGIKADHEDHKSQNVSSGLGKWQEIECTEVNMTQSAISKYTKGQGPAPYKKLILGWQNGSASKGTSL